ncbi:MAG: hypothetical protein KF764_04660 [Labilithrix sp.]|nr:hypothetical protein [Labilithrix sp.]
MTSLAASATVAGCGDSECAAQGSCAGEAATEAPPRGEDGTFTEPDAAPKEVAPVSGEAEEGSFSFVPTAAPPRVMHDTSLRVKLAIERSAAQKKDVVVTVANLPPGVSVEPLTINGHESTGELVVNVGATAAQGPFDILVEGSTGKQSATLALALFVRGKPGTLDTTFAAGGVLTPPDSPLGIEAAGDALGRIYVGTETSLRRYSSEGLVDTSFAAPALDQARPLGVVVHTGSVYFARNVWASQRIEKYSTASGARDATYGGGSGIFHLQGSGASAFAVAADGRGALIAPFYSPGRWHLKWVSAAGTDDFTVNSAAYSSTSPPSYLIRGAVYTSNAVVFVGEGHILKVKTAGGIFDSTFAGRGFLEVASGLALNDVIADASGRFLVTGQRRASGALYLARITAGGELDSTFPPVTGTFAAKGEAFMVANQNPSVYDDTYAGRLALDAENNILQAAQVAEGSTTRCTLLRYRPDGKLDTSFGDQGRTTLATPGCTARRVFVQPDGRILVGGAVLMRVWN